MAFVSSLLKGAEKQAFDYQPLLNQYGISRQNLENEQSRIPLRQFAAFAVDLMRQMDDEFIGLTDRRQPLGSFAMMCRACITSQSIRHSLKRCANYWNLFENGFEHRVLVSGGRAYYQLVNRTQTQISNYAAESMLSAVHRFHCWLAGEFIPLLSVSFDFSQPSYHDEYKPLFYGAPIRYEHDLCQIELDTRNLSSKIVQTTETIETYLAGTNLSLLALPRHYRALSDQTRQWLEKNIKLGQSHSTQKECAAYLKMDPQALHRRLSKEDTSFNQLKMQTRRDIAINLLYAKKLKVEDIARVVGFSEPSAFVRAFKAWTGKTPLAYRQDAIED